MWVNLIVCVCVQLHLLLLHLCSFERVSVFKCVHFFVNLLLVCVCVCLCVCVCMCQRPVCLSPPGLEEIPLLDLLLVLSRVC